MTPRPAGGGRTKSGKPRPGTGGYGKRKLEGKGPTPPAELRPGHPAQRRAAAQARKAAQGKPSRDTASRNTSSRETGGRDTASRDIGGRDSGGRGAAGAGAGARGSGARGAGSRAPGSRAVGTRAPGSRGAGSGRGPGQGARGTGTAAELVAGRNPVLEALQAGIPATALHVGPRLDSDERISQAVMLAADAGIPVVEAGRAELDRITGGAIHQGLALRIRRYAYADPADLLDAGLLDEDLPEAGPIDAGQPGTGGRAAAQPLIVALDGVTDPRNLGAVARSVAAFGGTGILLPTRRSAGVTAGAWKASAGTLARVRVAQTANLARALVTYQEAGLFVVGLDAEGSADIGDLELADAPLVLVVGSEGKGLSRLVAERCDALARIPITGAAESLNAGIAASIALYAVSRLRAELA